MSGKGARHGEPMAIVILLLMTLLWMYWISGLSGASPVTNSTAAGFLTPVFNNAKGFIAMFASISLMVFVRGMTMMREHEESPQRVVLEKQESDEE